MPVNPRIKQHFKRLPERVLRQDVRDTLDRANNAIGYDGSVVPSSARTVTPYGMVWWYVAGNLAATGSGVPVGPEFVVPQRWRLIAIRARVKTAPSSAITLRTQVNGVNSSLLQITVGQKTGQVIPPGQLFYNPNDVLTLNITGVGLGTPGADLTVNLVYQPDVTG